jgi:hypothetical protein
MMSEDTAEIRISKPNRVRFEVRREQNGIPSITIRDLLKPPYGTGLTASSWARFAWEKLLTCCKH